MSIECNDLRSFVIYVAQMLTEHIHDNEEIMTVTTVMFVKTWKNLKVDVEASFPCTILDTFFLH